MTTNASPDPKTGLWAFTAYYLRFCRTQRGLSGEAVGRLINASKATVSRIENGVDRLDGSRAALLDKAWETGGLFTLLVWYASIGHDPQWLAEYKTFEQRSRLIRIFEPLLISGLFQTEEYARALFTGGGMPDPEPFVIERMKRKDVLDRAFVKAVIGETALRWPVGSPQIMRDQLAHVLEVAERPNVVLHVVPQTFETGAYPGLDGALKLLKGDEFGEVAYTESIGGGRLVSSPIEVAEYAILFARISAKALPEHRSKELVEQAMEAFSDDDVAQEQSQRNPGRE
ncbi:helix-turn-helix domain-containing protein [Actinomadura madurae]|uniref:helix-turn-helix domain-containing protein n=1 Tax=Actinomadura madurae TaxID=1993 RepID=UPI0020266CF8|nr:helix-turn-helix transcriptional regulator [Actinomadura madurae]MCP9954140.1 helix-turn-helix transcriptional regulator [Actinomadura madurae]MCP9970889.1 helix-turn-helix transcriptional regulator [Actinomadura madurae]MCP9983365.1 helix-turn-helix transcriptional regulator [Actinomadura madurae]MCQ0005071.1 helix-turn-helix transcriptional regulator [Actinomadura madurae]MCQ0019617.1 helix-turn-helix transcriptional regulator [Actinomadura madurae]